MAKLGDDLFASYRKYKGMDVDSPQYKPLENGVMDEDELKKLKTKESYAKNKDKIKMRRLEKTIENLRLQNRALKKIAYPPTPTGAFVDDEDKVQGLLDMVKELQSNLAHKEREFDEFKSSVKVIIKYL